VTGHYLRRAEPAADVAYMRQSEAASMTAAHAGPASAMVADAPKRTRGLRAGRRLSPQGRQMVVLAVVVLFLLLGQPSRRWSWP